MFRIKTTITRNDYSTTTHSNWNELLPSKKNQHQRSTELKNEKMDLFFYKLLNLLMKDGKKTKASKILLTMLLVLKQKIIKELERKNSTTQNSFTNNPNLSLNPTHTTNTIHNISHTITPFKTQKEFSVNFTLLRLISRAIENITPNVEVRKVRVAGSTYIVPAIISKKKQETLALKWLIESAKKRQKSSKFSFASCLADEILDASKKMGLARQKRDELHRLAQTNRAYIRYRWW